jgi:hypothetical protein
MDVPAVYYPPASFSKVFSSKFRLRRQIGLPSFLQLTRAITMSSSRTLHLFWKESSCFWVTFFRSICLATRPFLFFRINKEESFTQSNQRHQTTDWRIVTLQSNIPRDHVFCPDELVIARLVGFVAPIVSIRGIFEDLTHGFSGCHPVLDLSRDLPAHSRIAYHHDGKQNM